MNKSTSVEKNNLKSSKVNGINKEVDVKYVSMAL